MITAFLACLIVTFVSLLHIGGDVHCSYSLRVIIVRLLLTGGYMNTALLAYMG